MNEFQEKFTKYLSGYVSSARKKRMEEVLAQRTRHLTVVLEDIFKDHNASAVVRTCECLGIQDLHIIENKHSYQVNRDVVKGASKWIDIFPYNKEGTNNTQGCYKQLRKAGYRIVATSPRSKGITPDKLPLKEKVAIIFGTEYEGLSDYALKEADEILNIPLYGFTESYNLSVSVAVCVSELATKLRQENIAWQLSDIEKDSLRVNWFKKMVKRSDALEREFRRDSKLDETV